MIRVLQTKDFKYIKCIFSWTPEELFERKKSKQSDTASLGPHKHNQTEQKIAQFGLKVQCGVFVVRLYCA